jgi:Zn-dependent protease
MTDGEERARIALMGQLREALRGVIDIKRYAWDAQGYLTLDGPAQCGERELYRELAQRCAAFSVVPHAWRERRGDVVVTLRPASAIGAPRWRWPVVLFIATVLTTTLTGALNELDGCVVTAEQLWRLLTPAGLAAGLPFSLTLIGILLAHELGHSLMARRHGEAAGLPHFIPLPPPLSITGTLGAVIVQQAPQRDRRTILEVGIAGPLAGMLVAVPALLYGLSISPVGPLPAELAGCTILQEGDSLLTLAAERLVLGQTLPAGGVDVWLSPVAFGAWIGLLVTMINLLPVGQLDGGHIAYAVLGRPARYLGGATIAACLIAGVLVPDATMWLTMGLMGLFIGVRHPLPVDDITPLGAGHRALACVGLLLFLVLLLPVPLRVLGGP